MKKAKYRLQYLAVVSLLLLTASGIYDAAAGVQATRWYLRWHEEHYGAMAVPSVIFTYCLGLFRGAVTLCCGGIGLAQATKGRIRAWYLVLLGVCTSWYVGSMFHHAYRGISQEKWTQMLIAVSCFAAVTARQWAGRRRAAHSGEG